MKKSGSAVKSAALFLCIALLAALCLGLSACGSSGSPMGPEQTEQPQPEESSSQQADPNGVTATASILSTGDILIHSPFLTAYCDENGKYDFREIFQFTKAYSQSADFAVANLEVSLGGEEAGEYSGYPNFNCPDAIVDALIDSGYDMLLTANNHVGDTGFTGFEREQRVLTEKGVQWMGTVADASDKRYQVVDVNGIKIGMVNYTYVSHIDGTTYLNGVPISDEFAARLNTFDYEDLDTFYDTMEQCMAGMKADGAEATILYIHWGEEYHLEPMDYQEKIAQKMCDIGFDAIVGGHPHVVEPVEVLTSSETGKKTVCLYSMGNEISNQRHELLAEDISTSHTEDGLFFYTNFSRKGDGTVELTSVNVIPTWVHMYYNKNDRRTYEIVPLDKSADWNTFNLSATETGMEEAEASYERTMDLTKKGVDNYNRAAGAAVTAGALGQALSAENITDSSSGESISDSDAVSDTENYTAA